MFSIVMACFGVPFILLSFAGVWAWTEGEGLKTLFGSAAIFGLGLSVILEGATVRLHASKERLWLTRFWRTRWSVPREDVELRAGRVGDVAFIPGLIVLNRRTGKKVGEIITHQFAASDMARLLSDLDKRC